MGLTFLTPLLLAGAALIAVPIVLHLVMRQVPKHLLFPAIRFIQQREQANRRQLRLRHLLLLLLRIGAILFLAVALARPSIKTQSSIGSQEAPVAAALIFDTSPRMEYRHENLTRLAVAQETALWLLGQLPADSEAVILESEEPPGEFAVDLGAAEQRVKRLKPSATATPLADSIQAALELLKKKPDLRKEMYIFTDLAAGAWPVDQGRLKSLLADAGDVGLYVIDVGLSDPRNFALGDIKVSPEVSAKNGKLHVQTDTIRVGPEEERNVAIYVLDAKGTPQLRGQQTLHWSEKSESIDFPLTADELGTHQGYVQIMGEDNLPADDRRYFTYDVRPPFRVLVAAPQPAKRHALFLTEAIAPDLLRKSGRARFDCETIAIDQLPDRNLEEYSAVCLLDPTPLSADVWQRLSAYVRQGGGLAVWLGRNARPIDRFNDPAALALLPGKPTELGRSGENGVFLSTSSDDHALLAHFRPIKGTVPWSHFPVWEYWKVALAEGATKVIPYSNGDLALLERPVGRGRVLMMTTPVSDAASDPQAWNQLATGFQPWPFVMLANEMTLYLVGSGEEELNYSVGGRVVLRLDDNQTQSVFSLALVGAGAGADVSAPLTADQANRTVSVPATTAAGNYRIQAGGTEGGVNRGFSANIPAKATDLTRIKPEALDTLLGAGRYRLAHGREEIDRSVNVGRVGRELYPILICLVALALGLEHLLANRFYRQKEAQKTRKRFSDMIAESQTPAAPASSVAEPAAVVVAGAPNSSATASASAPPPIVSSP